MYRSKTADEVSKEVRENRARLNELRFNLAAGKTANVKEIRSVRRAIAQLLTVANTSEKTS